LTMYKVFMIASQPARLIMRHLTDVSQPATDDYRLSPFILAPWHPSLIGPAHLDGVLIAWHRSASRPL